MDLAARPAVVQPAADGDRLAFVSRRCLRCRRAWVTAVRTPIGAARSRPVSPEARPRANRALQDRGGVAVVGQLEHERPGVADLLHAISVAASRSSRRTARGGRRRVPSLSWTCVVMMCPASALGGLGDAPSRCAWPKSRQMPASPSSSSPSSSRDERRRRRQIVRDHFERQPDAGGSAQLGDRLEAAAQRAARRCRRRHLLPRGSAEVQRRRRRQPRSPRGVDRRARLVDRFLRARPRRVDAFEYARPQTPPPKPSVIGACMLPASSPVVAEPAARARRPRAGRDSRSASASRTPRRASKPCAARSLAGGARVEPLAVKRCVERPKRTESGRSCCDARSGLVDCAPAARAARANRG